MARRYIRCIEQINDLIGIINDYLPVRENINFLTEDSISEDEKKNLFQELNEYISLNNGSGRI